MKSRRTCALAAAALFVLTTFAAAPTAAAQDDEDTAGPAPFTLSFGDMGVGGTLSLNGVDGRAQVTIPVVPGSAPGTLFATAAAPMGVGQGWLDVSSGGRSLTRIALPEGVAAVPFSAPLGGLPVVDNAVTLDISTTLVPIDGYCIDTGDGAPVRIIDASVAFTGQPAIPATISQFLPPVLNRLTVYLPGTPDADQSEAAIALTTSVVKYYGAQPVRIRILPDDQLTGAELDGPLDRSVAIVPNTDGGTQLIYPTQPAPPTLFVTGTGNALLDQVKLITSSISALAVATSASAGALAPPPTLSSDSISLDDLGVGTVTASGPGTVSVTVPIDQTRLGRSAQDVAVHLLGSYTPLPNDLGGSVTATVGDKSLAVLPADSTGRIDQWIDIPSSVAERITNIDVTLTTTSGGPGCGGTSRLTIDGASAVNTSSTGTPTPPGFGSIPQTLMPRVAVAMSEQTFENTVRAVTVLTGLQRLSALPLAPQLVSVDDVANGDASAVLIAPDGAVPESISLPLRGSDSTTFTVGAQPGGQDASLTVDGNIPFGSLQVAYDSARRRTVLVASSMSAPDQLDRALTWLDADPSRWFGLSGDVLFEVDGQDPIALSSAELTASADTASVAEPDTTSPSNPIVRIIVVIGAAVSVIAVAVALVLLIRTRRRGGTSAP